MSDVPWRDANPWAWPIAAIAGLVLLQIAVLSVFGQPPICACGTVRLWTGAIADPQNSQQISDWYTFSHIIHGILFYAGLKLVAPRAPLLWRLAVAVGIEVGWEILENTPMVIERYRQQALAVGYSGDSILNSICDTLAMMLGFVIAARLPVLVVVALVVGLELFTAAMVRDNLTLNVIQLISPSRAISDWQAGGGP